MRPKGILGLSLLFLLVVMVIYIHSIQERMISVAVTQRKSTDDNLETVSTGPTSISNTPLPRFAKNKRTKEKAFYLKIPKDFNLSISLNPCMKEKPTTWTMYIFVKSAVANFRNREILRRTWALVSYLNGGRFATVFVVGNTTGQNQALLDEESQRYDDVLQIDASDEYRNIGQKTLAGMHWAKENLPGDYFYSSADDDFLVNMGRVQKVIDENRKNVNEKQWPEFPILCMYKKEAGDVPARRVESKYYISPEEYMWPHWPDFCLGGMYTTSVRVAGKLWEASRTEKPIKMDDVWITGILRERIGMPRQYVQAINPSPAEHYEGFSDKKSVTAKEYVTKHWKENYNFIKGTIVCNHDHSR